MPAALTGLLVTVEIAVKQQPAFGRALARADEIVIGCEVLDGDRELPDQRPVFFGKPDRRVEARRQSGMRIPKLQ